MAVTKIQLPNGTQHDFVDGTIAVGTDGTDAALVHLNPETGSNETLYKFGSINGVDLDQTSVKQKIHLPSRETSLITQENVIYKDEHRYNHNATTGETTVNYSQSILLSCDTPSGLTLSSSGLLSWDGKIATGITQWGQTASFDENTTGGIILMTNAESAAMSYPTMTGDNYFLLEMDNMGFRAEFSFYLLQAPGTTIPSTGYYNGLQFTCRYEGGWDININKVRTNGSGVIEFLSQTGRYTSGKIWCIGQLLDDSLYLPSLYNNKNLVLFPDTEMMLEGATVKVSLWKVTEKVSYEECIKSKQDKPTFDSETNTLIFP